MAAPHLGLLEELAAREEAKRAHSGWNIISTAELFAPLGPYPWLMKALHLAPGRITLLAGYPDVGKTVIVMTIAMAIASGRPLWELYKPERTGKVLHLNAEIGSYLAKERYQRIARAMGVDVDDLVKRDALLFSNYPTPRLDDPAFELGLMTLCKGVALVVIDSLRAFSGALDEKDKAIGVALLMLARVSEATGATIVVLHHTRKDSKDDVGALNQTISGSSSILGAAECAFVLVNDDGFVTVNHVRSPVGRPLEPFGLRFVDVESPDDKRWGLGCVHLDPEQMAQSAEASRMAQERAEQDKASSAIRETLKRYAGVFRGGKEAFRAECNVGMQPFRRALGAMLTKKEVCEGGSYHKPEWHLVSGLIQTESRP